MKVSVSGGRFPTRDLSVLTAIAEPPSNVEMFVSQGVRRVQAYVAAVHLTTGDIPRPQG
jgi:hypothetical protein